MDEPHDMSDEALRLRTKELVFAAQKLSSELLVQTEKLNAAIDVFNKEYIDPLREGLESGDDFA
jgi:hypothetical protein